MRRAAAALILVCLLAGPAMAAKAVAQVDGCLGPAHVLGKSRRALYLGDQLFAGETVALTPGTVLTVAFYSDGHREQVEGPGQLRVSATGLRGPGVARLGPDDSVPLLPSARRTMEDYIPMGAASRAGSGYLILRYPSGPAAPDPNAPFAVSVPSIRPEIRWEERGKRKTVQITMYQGTAGQVLWQKTAQRARLPYPPDVPPLQPGGSYAVEAQVAGSDDPDERSMADFTVAPAAAADRIAAAERQFEAARETDATNPTPYSRMALIYLDHHALADAARVMEMLEAADPDEPGPHRFLLSYYRWMGWSGAADFERKALHRLGIDVTRQGRPQATKPAQ